MKEGKIRTEFRTKEAAEELGLSPEDRVVWTELQEFLSTNKKVEHYTKAEAVETATKLDELKNAGYRGILHIVSSPFTADFVRRAIPLELRPFVEEMYWQPEGRKTQSIPKFEHNLFNVGTDGRFDKKDKERLQKLLKDRIGIMIGGGPGYPDEPSRTPLLKALEGPIKSGTPFYGTCLGHQDLGVLAGFTFVHGVTDAGPNIFKPTKEGKRHPVVGRFGEKFGAQMFNTAVIIPGESATVLARGISMGESVIETSYNLTGIKGQAFSGQEHPEISVGTGYPGQRRMEKTTEVEIEGEKIVVPAGMTVGMCELVKFAAAGWGRFKKIGMKVEDVKDLLREPRLFKTLGKDFFGPTIDWMANFTSEHSQKRIS